MGGPRFVEFEACAVRKGWLTPDQLSGAIHLYEAYAASGDVRPLADICVAEGYLTPEQAVELTGQVKFPASCPSCGARFKIGGRKPEKGWTCARCGGALRPVNELLAVPPAEKKPAPTGPKARRNREPLGAAQGRPESEAPPRPKSKRVLWISAGGAAVAVLIVVLAVAISGTDESRPAPSPAGGTQLTTDPGKEQARLDAVREEWARASEALEAFRKDPSLASRTLALLEPLAERAKGTTYEAPARRGMEEIRAAAAREDEKALGPVRELVERGDLHAAASLIKTHLDDPATPPTLSSSLKQLQARIAERAPASYDRLLNEARRLASESRSNDARAHLLRATAWGIPEYALRARKDADGLGGTAPANLPPPPAPVAVVDPAMLKSALEERARAEFGKLENDADRLVQAGKLQEAIARCEAFLAEYRQTSAGAPAERRLALLRSQIAAAPAEKPAPGTRPAEPGVTVGAPRKPRDAGIRPGMLSEEEKKKKHAELAGEARKEQKGALKAAAARRSEWLAGLEKEFGIYDITTLVDKGDVAKRVDVVIVSSGYPKADAKKVDTLADALKAALKKAGGQAVEIELLLRGDKAVYEVKIVAEGKMVDVNVDGVTGKVAGGAGKQDAPFTEVFMEDAADLGPTGTNPYFVLEPGYQLTLEGKDEGEDAVLVITVLEETKKVDGVETRVVEERETVGGKLIEVSRNWFAISRKTNNVYYFGEDVDMYKDGKVTGHGGSWESGKDGAKWGLQMPGVPLLGSRYYQEVAPKVAMDRAEIVSLSVTLETPAGKFEKCLKCEETTPLEPGNRESKIYARGIGLIQDGPLKLTKHGKAKK